MEKKNAGRRSAIDEAKRAERNEAKRVERNEKARNINEAKRLERNEKARNIDEEKRLERNEKARIKRANEKARIKLKAGASVDNMAVGKFDGKHLMNDIFSSSTKSEQEINEKNADDEVEFLQELNFLQEFIRDDENENGGHNQRVLIKTEQEQGIGVFEGAPVLLLDTISSVRSLVNGSAGLLDSLTITNAADSSKIARAYIDGYNDSFVTLDSAPLAVNVVFGGTQESPMLWHEVIISSPSQLPNVHDFISLFNIPLLVCRLRMKYLRARPRQNKRM